MIQAENFISVMFSKHPIMQKSTYRVYHQARSTGQSPSHCCPEQFELMPGKAHPQSSLQSTRQCLALMGFGCTIWIYNHTSIDANRPDQVKGLLAQKGMKCLLLTQQRSGSNHNLPHKGEVQKLCFSGSGFSPENHSLFNLQ